MELSNPVSITGEASSAQAVFVKENGLWGLTERTDRTNPSPVRKQVTISTLSLISQGTPPVQANWVHFC